MHFTVYFPRTGIYALHSVLALCVPLCSSLSTFPVHASMNFTLHFPSTCLYAFHCLLSLCVPLCISLSTHFTVYLPYACLYAFHCALSLRVPLCISLSTFRLCSRSCGDVLPVLLLHFRVATSQPDPCRRSRADHEDSHGTTARAI